MNVNLIIKYSKKHFASLRDFSTKKKLKKTIREMDTFNRIPHFKLDKTANLFNDSQGMGEFDKSEVEDFVKRKKEDKLDRVDLAKRKLKFEKENLEKQIKDREGFNSYEFTTKITEQILNRESSNVAPFDHPEFSTSDRTKNQVKLLTYEDYQKHINSTDANKLLKQEYGNYSRFFAIEKHKEPNSKSNEKTHVTNINYLKKLENIMAKYNQNTKEHKSFVNERDLRLAKRLNRDLQRTDLTFDYADFLKQDEVALDHRDADLETEYKLMHANLEKSIYDLDKFGPDGKNILDRTLKLSHDREYELDRSRKIVAPNGSLVRKKILESLEYLGQLELEKNKQQGKRTKVMLSFEAQEDLYKEYLSGFSLQELSLKYGILPKTAKKYVCERYIYWNLIFPKIGPLRHKKLMEKAMQNPDIHFVDYGVDLEEMLKRETTVPLKEFKYSRINVTRAHIATMWFHKEYQKRKKERIPIKYVGSFHDGHLIFEEFVRRGKAAFRPSNTFLRYLNFKDYRPGKLPDKLLKRKSLGPRIASNPFDYIV